MTVIPSFAVDRTEVVLFHLRRLIRAGALPPLPVYVDSPMALAALAVYRARARRRQRRDLQPQLRRRDDPFDPGDLHEARTVEESKAINAARGPAVIISASGMATGGRVLHHLLQRLPDERNTVILSGFQAEGTRGRALLERRAGDQDARPLRRRAGRDRARPRLLGARRPRRARSRWLAPAPRPPETVYIVHGEPDSAAGAAARDRGRARLDGGRAAVSRSRAAGLACGGHMAYGVGQMDRRPFRVERDLAAGHTP